MKLQLKSRKALGVFQIIWLAAFLGFLSTRLQAGRIVSSQDFDQVKARLEALVDPAVYPQSDLQKIRRELNLDPALFENIAMWRNDDTLSAGELVLAKSDDPAALDQFAAAAQNRIEEQMRIFEGYAPEQYATMKDALVNVQGNYALYYAGDNPEALQEAFLAALKGGN